MKWESGNLFIFDVDANSKEVTFEIHQKDDETVHALATLDLQSVTE